MKVENWCKSTWQVKVKTFVLIYVKYDLLHMYYYGTHYKTQNTQCYKKEEACSCM